MFLVKSKNNPLIGLTGSLNYTPHKIMSKSFFPKIRLTINICTPSYYILGFGKKIRWKIPVHIYIRTDYDRLRRWWKRRVYSIQIFIQNEYLYYKILKR